MIQKNDTRHAPTLTDAEAVTSTLTNPDLFEVLTERYTDKLARYIWRLGIMRREDREDILQNVFIAAFRNLNFFDQHLSFSSWIYRITHNETMNWFRRSGARPEYPVTFEDDSLLSLLREEGTPVKEAIAKERASLVRAALAKLPVRYREPLALRFFDGRSYAEIARVLRMPVGTVATLVRRGKERLRSILDESPQGHG